MPEVRGQCRAHSSHIACTTRRSRRSMSATIRCSALPMRTCAARNTRTRTGGRAIRTSTNAASMTPTMAYSPPWNRSHHLSADHGTGCQRSEARKKEKSPAMSIHGDARQKGRFPQDRAAVWRKGVSCRVFSAPAAPEARTANAILGLNWSRLQGWRCSASHPRRRRCSGVGDILTVSERRAGPGKTCRCAETRFSGASGKG
jgi:hypothetical protein